MTISLDKDLCQGHAVCVGESPDLFQIGADGKVSLTELAAQGVPATLQHKARLASRYCPTKTIRISEG